MAIQRRAATAPPPAAEGVNFGSLDMYVAGGGLPEGDYALEFTVQMYQATKQTGQAVGAPRLGVMVSAHSLSDPAADPKTQFYSMGSNADKTFAPNPETGKGVVPIPGAVGATMNNSTNWAIFLKSLYDCGLPQGIFINDISVLDGIWVHLTPVPEPEERKGFGASKTGEVAEPERKGTIAIVTEIKEDGKPWEGTGGFLEAAAPAPKAAAKPAARVATVVASAKPGPKAIARPAPAPAVVEEVAPADDDVMVAAITGASSVLEKSPAGVTRLLMRTGTYKAVNDAAGPEMAQAVINTFFGSDEMLASVLGQLGYGIVGVNVKPLA